MWKSCGGECYLSAVCSQGINSGHMSWEEVCLPTEPFSMPFPHHILQGILSDEEPVCELLCVFMWSLLLSLLIASSLCVGEH